MSIMSNNDRCCGVCALLVPIQSAVGTIYWVYVPLCLHFIRLIALVWIILYYYTHGNDISS